MPHLMPDDESPSPETPPSLSSESLVNDEVRQTVTFYYSRLARSTLDPEQATDVYLLGAILGLPVPIELVDRIRSGETVGPGQ